MHRATGLAPERQVLSLDPPGGGGGGGGGGELAPHAQLFDYFPLAPLAAIEPAQAPGSFISDPGPGQGLGPAPGPVLGELGVGGGAEESKGEGGDGGGGSGGSAGTSSGGGAPVLPLPSAGGDPDPLPPLVTLRVAVLGGGAGRSSFGQSGGDDALDEYVSRAGSAAAAAPDPPTLPRSL